MTPHEIFLQMPPSLAERIFTYLLDEKKELYRATIDALVKPRKLRPIFIERKPRKERHAWMLETLGKKNSNAVAAHLLQICLVGQHSKVLCDFLDSLGIAHDENGTVDSLPPEPPREAMEKAVEELLAKHEREIVALYLQSFNALDDTGWTTLGEILKTDPRLSLSPPV